MGVFRQCQRVAGSAISSWRIVWWIVDSLCHRCIMAALMFVIGRRWQMNGLDAMFQIQGWNVASALNFPQPGYVAIRPSNGPNGHMGILDFDGMAISAQADLVRSEHDT